MRKCATLIKDGLPRKKLFKVPNGQYTITQDGSGQGLDVYYNGQLLMVGEGNDYTEFGNLGGKSTRIKFNFTLKSNSNVTTITH